VDYPGENLIKHSIHRNPNIANLEWVYAGGSGTELNAFRFPHGYFGCGMRIRMYHQPGDWWGQFWDDWTAGEGLSIVACHMNHWADNKQYTLAEGTRGDW
jgi:hypothetical protein